MKSQNHLDRVILITGACGGIGRYLTTAFANEGWQVIAMDVLENGEFDDRIFYLNCDISDADAVQNAFDDIKTRYDELHVLINNAAIAYFHKSIKDITVGELDQVIDVNLRGALLCCKGFIQLNSKADYGRIINIASTRWQQNEVDWEIYGATKGALVSLTQSLCVSLSNTPITVNCISPGWIQPTDYESLSTADHLQHPSRRVGRPEDIAKACRYLMDPENDFVNGINLVVDGGMTKKMIYI